tara:strand:- start:19262 stop:19789 length:528 start_codon:yes stop_codon:yes gene_type:complete
MIVPENRIYSIMVAISENGVIALQSGELPFNIEADKKYYLGVIENKIWIQARKSFENGPKSELRTKHNIILTNNTDYKPGLANSSTVHSIEGALKLASQLTENDEEIFIGGGMNLYSQALSFVDRLYMTRVHQSYIDGGAFFPAFDWKLWKQVKSQFHKNSQGPNFSIEIYQRKK